MTSDQNIGLSGLIGKINWSAVATGIGAAVSALWLVVQQNNGDNVLHSIWLALDSPAEWGVLIAAFTAAYKGTAKGSLRRKSQQPVAPVNDEGM